jgi:L-malate glycosyltransferase
LRAVTVNVLHVDTERGWRGGERQTLWLAAELGRRGHGSIIAAREREPLAIRGRAAGVEVVECAPSSEIDIRAAWRLRRVIQERSIDVVHAHTAHAVAVAAAATIRLPVPLIVARRVDFRLRNNVGTRLKYSRASMIVAVSQAVARVLEASGIDRTKIRVVPDGVDVHRVVMPASRDTLTSLGVQTDAPLVVQVAQLVGHKDPVNFVRAIARAKQRVPHIQALMLGDGPLRMSVVHEVRQLGLESTVHVAGFRDDADALLASATVACLSSREEGMGSVLLDALAFGLPIAATNAGGIPEVVVDGVSGLLAERENPIALGDAIATLLTDDALRQRVATNARARADQFSVERMTDQTVAVYDEALSGTGGGRRSRTNPANSSSSASVT